MGQQKIGFYVLPRGAAAGARGSRIGEIGFASEKDRDKFVRGVSVLSDSSIGPLLAGGGTSLSAKEAGQLLAKIQTAMSSSGESTLSSVMSAEVVELDQGPLEGKLDAFCALLQKAVRDGGLLTTLPE